MKTFLICAISCALWVGCGTKSTKIPKNARSIESEMQRTKAHLYDVSHIERKFLDIPYATLSASQKLDIFLPDAMEGPYPVVIFVHGGSFSGGDKRDGEVKPPLKGLERGYAIVGVNYRLSHEALFPANIMDIKASIRWVKAHADDYKLDTARIAIWGDSAGGHLASLAGVASDEVLLDDLSLGNPDHDSRIHVVVDWYGPTDFLEMDAQLMANGDGEPFHNEPRSPESVLLGRRITEVPDLVALANPENYVTSDDPVFLIEHGDEDPIVPVQQSERFYHKLVSTLGQEKVTLRILEGAGHGNMPFYRKSNVDFVFDFLDYHLGVMRPDSLEILK